MGKAAKTKALPIESGPDIRGAWVDAPLKTYSQYLHELDTGVPQAGREHVQIDRRTLMGGFCRFHGNAAQEMAAARFKAVYERAQVGGGKAVDPSREPVDGGGINPESVIEIGADARKEYNRLYNRLGLEDMRRLEFVIIGENGPTAYARWLARGKPVSGQVVGRLQVEFRNLMDRLATAMGYQNLKCA